VQAKIEHLVYLLPTSPLDSFVMIPAGFHPTESSQPSGNERKG
jgi:hypothetical protein